MKDILIFILLGMHSYSAQSNCDPRPKLKVEAVNLKKKAEAFFDLVKQRTNSTSPQPNKDVRGLANQTLKDSLLFEVAIMRGDMGICGMRQELGKAWVTTEQCRTSYQTSSFIADQPNRVGPALEEVLMLSRSMAHNYNACCPENPLPINP